MAKNKAGKKKKKGTKKKHVKISFLLDKESAIKFFEKSDKINFDANSMTQEYLIAQKINLPVQEKQEVERMVGRFFIGLYKDFINKQSY